MSKQCRRVPYPSDLSDKDRM